MYKYLHSYNREPNRKTWVLFTPELDVFHGVLLHSAPGDIIEQLHNGTKIWERYFKDMWLNNWEYFYIIYRKEGQSHEELDYLYGGSYNKKTSVKKCIKENKVYYENQLKNCDIVAYAVKLNPRHKIRYLPYSFGLDSEDEEIVIS